MENIEKSRTIFDIFDAACKKNLQKEAISFKDKDAYIWLTYRQLYTKALLFADFLKKNNLSKNDKIAIILENNPYWPVAFFGAMRLGAVTVPLCAQFEVSELAYLIKHSESRIIITSKNSLSKIKEAVHGLPIPVFAVDQLDILKDEHQNIPEDTFAEPLSGEQIASIVYTSGTTSQPKGVILTHGNLLSNLQALSRLNLILPSDNVISLLPLHHSYPFMVNLLLPLLTGAKISFPHTLNFEEILLCINKTKVTILVAVPRIYALFCEKIAASIACLPPLKKCALNLLLRACLPIRKYLGINLSRRVVRELHKKIGNDLRFMVSGGAKLKTDVAENFYKWGFTILEGYGLTETSPVIAFNLPSDFKIGSVGKIIPGVDVKIEAPDQSGVGEVIVKGPNVTQGYYKDPEFTGQAIKNGWLYTRDLGYFDKDGFLYIVGRKNETIVLTSGKKIDPEELETYYCKSPYIKEICIFLPESAKDTDLLTAVIRPDLEYFRQQGVSQIRDKIRFEIEDFSLKLPAFKRIRKYSVISETFPRTLLGKLKRFEIEKKYGANNRDNHDSGETQELSAEDKQLLSSISAQNALEYLSQKFKKPVKLDYHLELDLGLDSLGRIELLLELKDFLNIKIPEEIISELFYAYTVREIFQKTEPFILSEAVPEDKDETPNWQKVLNASSEKELAKNISVKLDFLRITANLFFAVFLYVVSRVFFQLKVTGKKNIPRQRPFIFCPNHTSYLDAPLFAAALDLPVLLHTYFLGFSAYINHPLLSWGKKLFRLIPLDPSSKLSDTLQVCGYVLKNSKILCMFPEGGRSMDGSIKEFKRGVGVLIKELNVDVVPVYIRGAYKAWPPGKTFPRISKIEFIFGKKITVEELTADQPAETDAYQNIANNLRKRLINLRNAYEV